MKWIDVTHHWNLPCRYYDTDHSNTIDTDELVDVLRALGQDLTMKEVKQILKKEKIRGEVLHFEEFERAVFPYLRERVLEVRSPVLLSPLDHESPCHIPPCRPLCSHFVSLFTPLPDSPTARMSCLVYITFALRTYLMYRDCGASLVCSPRGYLRPFFGRPSSRSTRTGAATSAVPRPSMPLSR
jgi:hypothetical protein